MFILLLTELADSVVHIQCTSTINADKTIRQSYVYVHVHVSHYYLGHAWDLNPGPSRLLVLQSHFHRASRSLGDEESSLCPTCTCIEGRLPAHH